MSKRRKNERRTNEREERERELDKTKTSCQPTTRHHCSSSAMTKICQRKMFRLTSNAKKTIRPTSLAEYVTKLEKKNNFNRCSR